MEWDTFLAAVREVLRERGTPCREIRGGIAIDFADDFDSFLVATGLLKQHDYGEDPSAAATALVDEFEHIDRMRTQVLIGIRHHAVEQKVALRISPSGTWTAGSANGCVGDFEVGPR